MEGKKLKVKELRTKLSVKKKDGPKDSTAMITSLLSFRTLQPTQEPFCILKNLQRSQAVN
jgi:hypothetical protein